MNCELYKDCISHHADVIQKIRLSAHKLHESVNQTYDDVLPYGYHLDMVVDAVYKYGHEVCAKLPVQNVSWNECQQFIAKLNKLTGRKFRLPTEAEWEFAARGGNASKGYKFAVQKRLMSLESTI